MVTILFNKTRFASTKLYQRLRVSTGGIRLDKKNNIGKYPQTIC
jgi:hypothetical protein